MVLEVPLWATPEMTGSSVPTALAVIPRKPREAVADMSLAKRPKLPPKLTSSRKKLVALPTFVSPWPRSKPSSVTAPFVSTAGEVEGSPSSGTNMDSFVTSSSLPSNMMRFPLGLFSSSPVCLTRISPATKLALVTGFVSAVRAVSMANCRSDTRTLISDRVPGER